MKSANRLGSGVARFLANAFPARPDLQASPASPGCRRANCAECGRPVVVLDDGDEIAIYDPQHTLADPSPHGCQPDFPARILTILRLESPLGLTARAIEAQLFLDGGQIPHRRKILGALTALELRAEAVCRETDDFAAAVWFSLPGGPKSGSEKETTPDA